VTLEKRTKSLCRYVAKRVQEQLRDLEDGLPVALRTGRDVNREVGGAEMAVWMLRGLLVAHREEIDAVVASGRTREHGPEYAERLCAQIAEADAEAARTLDHVAELRRKLGLPKAPADLDEAHQIVFGETTEQSMARLQAQRAAWLQLRRGRERPKQEQKA
jgi:hypothetical protein